MKNKAILAFLGFAAALFFALPAMAQKSTSGFYAGASIGQGTSADFCFQSGPTCKDQDQTWGVQGGYMLGRNFAVEAGYQNLGDNSDPTTPKTARGQVMEIGGIGSYYLNRDWSIYAKVGGFRGRLRGSIGTASFNESNTDVTLGVGLQWHVVDALSLRAQLQRYPRLGGGAVARATDYDVWTLGAIFKFD